MTDRESVRVCKWCGLAIRKATHFPAIWVHNLSGQETCTVQSQYTAEPLAEPAEPSHICIPEYETDLGNTYCKLCHRWLCAGPPTPLADPHPAEPTAALCEVCGELMPLGEEMFKYHGSSGPCPRPFLERHKREIEIAESLRPPSLPSTSDREQVRYESPAACGHPRRYLTSSSPGASDVICAICRLAELERELAKYTANEKVADCVDCHGSIWFREARISDESGTYHPMCRVTKERDLERSFRRKVADRLEVIGCVLFNYAEIQAGCDSNIQWRNKRAEAAESQVAVMRETLQIVHAELQDIPSAYQIRARIRAALTPSPESIEEKK